MGARRGPRNSEGLARGRGDAQRVRKIAGGSTERPQKCGRHGPGDGGPQAGAPEGEGIRGSSPRRSLKTHQLSGCLSGENRGTERTAKSRWRPRTRKNLNVWGDAFALNLPRPRKNRRHRTHVIITTHPPPRWSAWLGTKEGHGRGGFHRSASKGRWFYRGFGASFRCL